MKNNLIKWIVIHQHPFTIVEKNNFINFIHTLLGSNSVRQNDLNDEQESGIQ